MKQEGSNERLVDLLMSSFWRRLGAWLVDQAILTVPIAILLYLSYLEPLPYFKALQLTIVLNVAYFTALEGSWAQTAGKRLMGILVYEEGGRTAGYKSALLRRMGLVIPIFFLIDALMILLTSRRQRIFDMVAGTVVVKGKFKADASRFLRGEDVLGDMMERSLIARAPKTEEGRDRRMLEKLREMREALEERFEGGEIGREEYLKLRSEYEARIRQLEGRLEDVS